MNTTTFALTKSGKATHIAADERKTICHQDVHLYDVPLREYRAKCPKCFAEEAK
jgi:hypothetical protein